MIHQGLMFGTQAQKNQRLGSNTEFVSLVDPRVGSNGLKLGFHQKVGSITMPVFVFTVNGAVQSGSVDLNIGYPIGIGETIKRYNIYIYILYYIYIYIVYIYILYCYIICIYVIYLYIYIYIYIILFIDYNIYWLVVWNMNVIFHNIFGNSSSQLTKSIIFRASNHQ